MSQVKLLFDSFAQSLEAGLSSLDSKSSQVMSDSASEVGSVVTVSSDVNQDVLTSSSSTPSTVARRS